MQCTKISSLLSAGYYFSCQCSRCTEAERNFSKAHILAACSATTHFEALLAVGRAMKSTSSAGAVNEQGLLTSLKCPLCKAPTGLGMLCRPHTEVPAEPNSKSDPPAPFQLRDHTSLGPKPAPLSSKFDALAAALDAVTLQPLAAASDSLHPGAGSQESSEPHETKEEPSKAGKTSYSLGISSRDAWKCCNCGKIFTLKDFSPKLQRAFTEAIDIVEASLQHSGRGYVPWLWVLKNTIV